MTIRQFPRLLLITLVGLALGLFARWLFASDPSAENQPTGSGNGDSQRDTSASHAAESIQRSNISDSQSTPVPQDEVEAALLANYERIRDAHLQESYRVDDERRDLMMSRGGTRDLTRNIGAYLMGEPTFPSPEPSDFLGLGFAGEIEAANVIARQADYLSRMTEGKVSPLKLELPEGAAIAYLPLEAIVSRLTNSPTLEYPKERCLNLAGIRDGFLAEFTLHLQDQWFELSVINRAHQITGLPIEHDEERLRTLFPRYDSILREKDAVSRIYLDSLRLELEVSED